MESLENLAIYQKREILNDWINSMDEYGLEELMVEFLEYEYGDDTESLEEE